VTLTATEKASGGAHVAGNVQFAVGGTDLGSPVAVDSLGVAAMTTTFAAPGKESLSAEFTPTSASYGSSKGTFSLVVRPVPPNVAGVVTISVMVPRTGAFTVTVQPGPVSLIPQGTTATGRLPEVTVTDTRNYRPGWSLSGQASKFTYSSTGTSVPGNELGWVPTVVGSLHDGAKLGRKVVAGRPGLGSAPATLAYAPAGCGSGKNVFSANLTLNIPRADDDDGGGRYIGTVTITYVESAPAPTDDDNGTCGSLSKPGGDR
jgi:Bacterial Ig-like domain (group 3)